MDARCFRAGIRVLLLLAALLLGAVESRAQQSAAMQAGIGPAAVVHGMIEEVAISPDGRALAWVEGESGGTEIFFAPLSDLRKSQRITAAAASQSLCREYGLAWAPDAMSLAFFSDCAAPGKQADLYLARLFAGPPRRLTALQGIPSGAAFSPAGESIAFLVKEAAASSTVQRLAVAQADRGGQFWSVLSPPGISVRAFDWSPDGHSLVYAAGTAGSGSALYTQPLCAETPACAPRLILDPAAAEGALQGMEIAAPRWSPDGKRIAFVAGSARAAGKVWVFDVESREARNLSQGRPTAAAWLAWESADRLYVNEQAGENVQLLRYRLPAGVHAATSFAAPIFSVPGIVDDGRGCYSLSATADRALFVFRAGAAGAPMQIDGAKPGVVMNAGIAGVLQLIQGGVTPFTPSSVPSGSNAGEEGESWRCHPAPPPRRQLLR